MSHIPGSKTLRGGIKASRVTRSRALCALERPGRLAKSRGLTAKPRLSL